MNLSRKLKTLLTYVACLMLALASPIAVYADEPAPTEQVEQTPSQPVEPEPAAPTAPEPAAPVPPEAPAPAAPVPPEPKKPDTTYTFDADTQKWNSNEWRWDSEAGKYVAVKKPVSVPAGDGAAPQSKASLNSATNSAIANALDSIATTGDAGVKNNTSGGNASTGDASASATIINSINSTMSNSSNKEVANFVMDIYGDVNGDIMLEPMLLKAMLEAKAGQNSGTVNTNVSNDASIRNDIDLTAQSGDAEVSGNTKAGSATSGSAHAVANVMNMVNSMIAANQSFDGTINIYGNLNGDILIAPDFLAQMLSNNGIQADASRATRVNARDSQEIVNNVSLAAESGAALVNANTQAGNATSGNAETNLVIFNMTGHDIVAANSLLVFINVLGSWVGVIVDAPQGATSAAIADGVTKNEIQPSMRVDATNDASIVNNIDLTARSGDATVTHNTTAGGATTGSATASANIANMTNSSMALNGWFGRLFINVFKSWNGSFGINTSAGNPIARESTDDTTAPQVIRFVQRDENANRAAVQRIRIVTPTQTQTEGPSEIKQASTEAGSVKGASTQSDIPSQQSYIDARQPVSIPLVVASLALILVSGFILRRFLF